MIRWDVDERRLSLYTRVYLTGMKLRRDKQAFEGAEHTLHNAEQLQASGDSPPTLVTRLLTRVERADLKGMTLWRVRPRPRRCATGVIYVHGGGYVHPLTGDYWRLVRALTKTPAEVIVPAYPLAPESTIDDASHSSWRSTPTPCAQIPPVRSS